MKKIISILLLIPVFIINTAMAVPDRTEQIGLTDGRREIIRTYEVRPGADPAELIGGPFERDGYAYEFQEINKEEIPYTSQKTVSKEIKLETQEKELADNLAKLEATVEYNQDGYSGTLYLIPASIKTEAAGYETRSYTVSDTKVYSDLAYNDNSLVPQTVAKNGMTLKLSSVAWQGQGGGGPEGSLIPTTYTATAHYTGTGSSTYATGYVITAAYSGEVAKSGTEKIIYTVIYSGRPIQEPEPESPPWFIYPLFGLICLILISVVTCYTIRHQSLKTKEEKRDAEKTG